MDATKDADASSNSTATHDTEHSSRSHAREQNAGDHPCEPSVSPFRKFRELLMARRFESMDNLPLRVIPGVYIGSFGAALNRDALVTAGITHVLCISPSLSHPFPSDFTYKRLALGDTADVCIADSFPSAITFIDSALASASGTVLVHCYAGRSRSATVVLAFLMARHAMPLDEALQLLRGVRPQVQPNSGFLAQLRAYERQLLDQHVLHTCSNDEA